VPVAYSYLAELEQVSWSEWTARIFGRVRTVPKPSDND
jgi:hypothetical protein